MTGTNYSLKWNELESIAANTFKDLVSDNHFSDVTLVCEDGEEINAHKIILSSCSSFFKKLFLKTKNFNKNMMIYLKGINSKDLELMMRFIYLGEAQVREESLPNFLEAGKDLKIDGLINKILPCEESEPISADSEPDLLPRPNLFNEVIEVNDEILLKEDCDNLNNEATGKEAVEQETVEIMEMETADTVQKIAIESAKIHQEKHTKILETNKDVIESNLPIETTTNQPITPFKKPPPGPSTNKVRLVDKTIRDRMRTRSKSASRQDRNTPSPSAKKNNQAQENDNQVQGKKTQSREKKY